MKGSPVVEIGVDRHTVGRHDGAREGEQRHGECLDGREPPPTVIVPNARAKGTRATKTGAVAFAPATNAAREEPKAASSWVAPSWSRAMLLFQNSRFRLPE
jgi:hypothetical protein